MRNKFEKYRLLGWISLVLIVGFLFISIASFVVSRNAIRQSISEQALPLTGDNIYSEIQKDLLKPIFISSAMAHDTFVRDWLLDGERNEDQLVRYLKEVKTKYGAISSFLVSERSFKYYYADGTLKSVRPEEPRDIWYFRVRKMAEPYEINVDVDMANSDAVTIFINHKVMDYHGNFLAATGIGLTLDTMAHLIDSYQQRFHRNIYFVNPDGEIVLSGRSMTHLKGNIHHLPGLESVAIRVLASNRSEGQFEFQRGDEAVMLNSRYLPELGWYLLVEQNVSEEMLPITRVLVINLAISGVITAVVLLIAWIAIHRYQQRLELVAGTDSLTGLLNRQAFEFVFQQSIRDTERTQRALSVILADIDFFKQINDGYGHLTGDRVLQELAQLAKNAVRDSDVVVRWGGEEFLLLLKNCSLEKATDIATNLLGLVENHDFGLPDPAQKITISLGVAELVPGENHTAFFSRADEALYQSKADGRNRVTVSPRSPTTETTTS